MLFSAAEEAYLDEEFKKVVLLYQEVKEFVIASEKADKKGRLSIAAINELRNAFDHVMRAQAVWKEYVKVPEKTGLTPLKYCLENISKSRSHLYRAGYDAFDIVTLFLSLEIRAITESVSKFTLADAFDDYWKEVEEPFKRAQKMSSEAKTTKDVESDEAGRQFYSLYKQSVADLEELRRKLYQKLSVMRDLDRERMKEQWRPIWIGLLGAAAGILTTLLVWYLSR